MEQLTEKEILKKAKNEAKKAAKAEKFKNKKLTFDPNAISKKKTVIVDNESITTNPGEMKDVVRELPKCYSSTYTEEGWFAWWEKKGFFTPEYNSKKSNEKFSIVIPPPNVTGYLHIGHALTMAIEDCIVRYNRMNGKQTLWLPGTDHAGIATQSVVEKKLMLEESKTRHDLGRESFIERVFEWKNEKGDRILNQIKKLGSSCDFSRLRFTMDEKMSDAVIESFIRLYEDDIIYRAKRLVNWSCTLKSAISDIEVEMKELVKRTMLDVPGYKEPVEFGVLVNFAYPVEGSNEKVFVATTRIETMLGDTGVAIHPEDSRYVHLHGKYVIHPFIEGKKLPIVLDDFVDREFGTGVVKITPAHDHNDYDVGKRHNLEFITILTDDGFIKEGFGEFSGMKRFDCRRKIMEKLDEKGLLGKIEDNKMIVPVCSRSKDIIEPLIKNQWYVKCQNMADAAAASVRNGDLELIPKGVHDGTWFKWLENCHDWCISRQLWWGHRIPMYRVKINNEYLNGDENSWICGRNLDEAKLNAKSKYNISDNVEIFVEQDPDVLDTWFSSQLFPFSTMGWPNESSNDLTKYYPTDLLETGHDILFFWVARMVMIGLKLTGKLPFKKVYLHAMVRDAHGRKMSKSLGNVLDPYDVINGIELNELQRNLEKGNLDSKELARAKACQAKDFPHGIPQCGTDALRFALISYTNQPRDLNLDVQRVFGYRTFCNKIWQAFKFCLNYGITKELKYNILNLNRQLMTKTDLWILSRLANTVNELDINIANYQFSIAASTMHSFWIYDFCDIYIEYSKLYRDNNSRKMIILSIMLEILNTGLRLLHPMMPFITEELYQRLPNRFIDEESIVVAPYPKFSEYESFFDKDLMAEFNIAMDITRRIRSSRKERDIKDKDTVELNVIVKDSLFCDNYLNDIILGLSKCICNASNVDVSDNDVILSNDKCKISYICDSKSDFYKYAITIKCDEVATEEIISKFGKKYFEPANIKEHCEIIQWCNWLNQQIVKGKSAVKFTLEFINERLKHVTYVADSKQISLADIWLLWYMEKNKIQPKMNNLNRWYNDINA